MAVANAPGGLKSPADAYLDKVQRLRRASPEPETGQARRVSLTPSSIPVEYWQEADGTWAAHSELLAVSAVADSEIEVFVEMAEQVEEYWTILSERSNALAPAMEAQLELRYLGLRFEKTPA